MKRSIAMLVSAGIFLRASLPTATEEKAPGVSLEQVVPYETAQDIVARDIVPSIGKAGLVLVSLRPSEVPGLSDLLITDDSRCGSRFGFAKVSVDGKNILEVSFDLFGQVADLTDDTKLQGHAMWDGTIGHGDEIAQSSQYHLPSTPAAAENILAYLKSNNDQVCHPAP
ncbi:MAG TPA: hypothetical protein VM124_00790 [Candidatus Limnocylindrales bacterium]|nr:hypothetical protein [Candidatus Limnocylindrales bacterium]